MLIKVDRELVSVPKSGKMRPHEGVDTAKDSLTISLVDTDLESVLSMSSALQFEGRTNIPMVPVRLVTRGGNGIYDYTTARAQHATQYEDEREFGILLLNFYGEWVSEDRPSRLGDTPRALGFPE